MKTLTLTQPWASLVAFGAKQIETRSWGTEYRGRIAIHAAKSFPLWARDTCRLALFDRTLQEHDVFSWHQLPVAAVVATATLVDCKVIDMFTQLPDEDSHERAFGTFERGRFMWLLDDIVALPQPVPARGALGLWEWRGAEIAA